MSIYNLTPSKATEWKPATDTTILELAGRGALAVTRLKHYLTLGRITSTQVLKNIDFSDMTTGAAVLKKYYAVLF